MRQGVSSSRAVAVVGAVLRTPGCVAGPVFHSLGARSSPSPTQCDNQNRHQTSPQVLWAGAWGSPPGESAAPNPAHGFSVITRRASGQQAATPGPEAGHVVAPGASTQERVTWSRRGRAHASSPTLLWLRTRLFVLADLTRHRELGAVLGHGERQARAGFGVGVGVATLRAAVHSCSTRPFTVSSFRWPDKFLSSVTR